MITISLCMIVKNEEATIKKCLDSVRNIVDEIIIVDTGSTDRTKEVASGFTDYIFDFEWINDFSAARNYSYEQATKDYILWLDADDVLLPEDAEKIQELKLSLSPETDVVMMKYNTGFDNNGNVTFSYYRERLSKRSRRYKWSEPVHECLEIWGKIINTDICVTHTKQHKAKSNRNIQIYEEIINTGSNLTPRGMYYYARELKEHERYEDSTRWFKAFLDTGKGWVEDNIASCGDMARCYLALDKKEDALLAMMRSFMYDVPRAEICCQIGYYFKMIDNYRLAAYWFELVLTMDKPKENWGFIQHDCWGYIPCLECTVCYDRLGEYEKAREFNDRAAEYKPDSAAVLYNKKYFENRFRSKNRG